MECCDKVRYGKIAEYRVAQGRPNLAGRQLELACTSTIEKLSLKGTWRSVQASAYSPGEPQRSS